VIETTGPDVVGPAVATDDPDAPPDEEVDHAAQVVGGGPVDAVQPPLQLGHPLALGAQLRFALLGRRDDLVDELRPDGVAQLGQATTGEGGVGVGRDAEAEPEFGVVLEQRV
jgi:hypothetical protein